MAEYIDREPLLEILNGLYNHHLTMGNYSADGATHDCIEAVIEAPTADVVPKSEVERLEQLLDSNCEKCVCAARKMLNEETVREIEILRVRHLKRIAEAKAEVAREIFEEIERFLYLQFRFCKEELGNGDTKYMEGRLELNTQIQNFIAELKKKYI